MSLDNSIPSNRHPVPAPRTRKPAAIAAATEQLRQKHQELMAVHKSRTRGRSSSAPSSPTAHRKLGFGDSSFFFWISRSQFRFSCSIDPQFEINKI